MKITKEQIVVTAEQAKEIATGAAKKAVETYKNTSTEEKMLCLAAAAVCVATLTAIKLAIVTKKTQKKLKDHEKRIVELEEARIFAD